MSTSTSIHVSEFIRRGRDEVYAYAADPRHLPTWAAGLSDSVALVDGRWVSESPMGRVVVEFAPPNDFGVLDHVVMLPSGDRVENPMRVLAVGEHSEVVFTLRRQPGTSDAAFATDESTVRVDLACLRRVLEAQA